jgi:ATP-dependent RNA helicase DeaD
MDQIVKADVDEEQIAPFMQDISRYFEYIDKDDLIKKIVSMEFGKFLDYYKNAPEIEPVTSKREARENRDGKSKRKDQSTKSKAQTSEGYRKLFINLGKKDGFYPGELMQFLNKNVRGHVEVGHIDLLNTMSYFEVPEEDAERVIKYVNGQTYKRREVRCNDANEGGKGPRTTKSHNAHESYKTPKTRESHNTREHQKSHKTQKTYGKDEWMQFLNPKGMKLKGDIPDFAEEGWAIRKPRKKKS